MQESRLTTSCPAAHALNNDFDVTTLLFSFGSGGMIDWHHPRVFERPRCFGLALFTLGIASHNTDAPVIAVSALAISVLQWTLAPILLGAFGVRRRLSDG